MAKHVPKNDEPAKTDFAMRANLPERPEPFVPGRREEHIYEQVLEKNKDGKSPFILHDYSPYANATPSISAMPSSRSSRLREQVHAQRGFFTPYVPGWDCHSQPIEHMVEKTLGPDKWPDRPATLRLICREWAEEYVDVQREGFERLGVNADWEHPYLGFTPNYEAGNVEVFKRMYLDGSVYRGRKPIHWCKRCHTALAEAEIEYSDDVAVHLREVQDGYHARHVRLQALRATPTCSSGSPRPGRFRRTRPCRWRPTPTT